MQRRMYSKRRVKNAGKTFRRLLSYIFKYYKFQFIIVLITIAISSLANIAGTYFISILIDNYIEPNIGNQFLISPKWQSALVLWAESLSSV